MTDCLKHASRLLIWGLCMVYASAIRGSKRSSVFQLLYLLRKFHQHPSTIVCITLVLVKLKNYRTDCHIILLLNRPMATLCYVTRSVHSRRSIFPSTRRSKMKHCCPSITHDGIGQRKGHVCA